MALKAEFEQLLTARRTAACFQTTIASLHGISGEVADVLEAAQRIHAAVEDSNVGNANILLERVRAPLIHAAQQVKDKMQTYGLRNHIETLATEHPDDPSKWRNPLRIAIRSEETAQLLHAVTFFDETARLAMHSVSGFMESFMELAAGVEEGDDLLTTDITKARRILSVCQLIQTMWPNSGQPDAESVQEALSKVPHIPKEAMNAKLMEYPNKLAS